MINVLSLYFSSINIKTNESIGEVIEHIKAAAHELHDVVCNQKYDKNKPYSYHLDMVANYAMLFGHWICKDEQHIVPLVFGAYFHDAIEDARMTYNDILKTAKTFMTDSQATIAAEIVYALTDEKGRNRKERGSDKHYKDIRSTLYAPFVKWCDRYANVKYSIETNSRMCDVYRDEMKGFVEKLGGTEYLNDALCEMILNL